MRLDNLLNNNLEWSEARRGEDPEFFRRLLGQQAPDYFWIGCSDSRVPANEIVGLPPGELFVHRNVANMVVHTDLNCLSAMQFAVDVLGVSHVIVCGHYGCGGVQAALGEQSFGLVDNWLRHVKDVRNKHHVELRKIENEAERERRLCELNVIEQVINVGETTVVREAWSRGQELTVHGWIYGLADGLLRDLRVSTSSDADVLASREQTGPR